ncbi:MAG: GNAT family N-acetyltransferase [Alphaproteobacteria bacterium]|nr:GNAT family N-acetyltransferase [Alphaproteobacteria bacterium]
MQVELAEAADAAAIAELHVDVWRATYADLAPPEALESLGVAVRLRQWQAALADSASAAGIFVIRSEGVIVGFAKAQRDPDGPMNGRGEIKHLYVSHSEQSRGLGRLLFNASASYLQSIKAPGIALGVVDGNDRAIAFYERLGGKHIGEYVDPGPLWRSRNLIYAWD